MALSVPRKISDPTILLSKASLADLLFFLVKMIRKAEREPETAAQSIRHAQRAFDQIIRRVTK